MRAGGEVDGGTDALPFLVRLPPTGIRDLGGDPEPFAMIR